ncbi:uncharacterized protein LOC143153810 isoform X2 [Ptiloglossa arizonensis]|uniref:uncharacterized protein LOC143153810 isoform X2 n=1 Tax=Ptiloglossa arizonensis TaxID=3350558 RepID=UPI003F9F5CBE
MMIGERGEEEVNPLGEYEGERNDRGERHGHGKTLLPNGDIYIGQYCKGLRHGKGLYVFKIGARYDGEWRRGLKYGQGTFWYPDGTRYEGMKPTYENRIRFKLGNVARAWADCACVYNTSSTCAVNSFQSFPHKSNRADSEWKHDTQHGFGVYYYVNGDVYEGSWKKNFRHGMGSYLYADTKTKFMGTWIVDRMQGPGQLIHPRHRFHGFWELNLPYGRGCFTFENACMQHGHYVHVKDLEFGETQNEIVEVKIILQYKFLDRQRMNDCLALSTESSESMDAKTEASSLKPLPLKKDVIPLWRARCITPYNPDLLPPEPVPLQEEVSLDSIVNKCSEELSEKQQYLQYPGEYRGEYEQEKFYEENDNENETISEK